MLQYVYTKGKSTNNYTKGEFKLKNLTKRIASSLLVVCMLIMGSASAFADTGDLFPYGTGKISCAFVDSNGEHLDNYRVATGRITFDRVPRTNVHYNLKMYYDPGYGDLVLANQADFTYNTQVSLSIDIEAKIPAGYPEGGTWYFEASWDDGADFKGDDNTVWNTDSPYELHDDSSARQYILIYPDGKLPWE